MISRYSPRRLTIYLVQVIQAAAALTMASAASFCLADNVSKSRSALPGGFYLSRQEVATAIDQGLAAAKEGKPATQVVESVRREPKWESGRRGAAKDCSVWFTSLDGADLRLRAHRSWDGRKSSALSGTLSRDSTVVGSLDFDVLLQAVPRNAKVPWRQDATADAADVTADRFEISDDHGNTISLTTGKQPDVVIEGMADLFPADPEIPLTGSGRAPRDEVKFTLAALAYAPDCDRPFYQARYHVHASLWDSEGHVRISPSAHEIRLTIVTRSGKMSVSYSLPAGGGGEPTQVARAFREP